jgi:LuxR family transcriptional regulator, maltose regulon positive regulatory protein
LIKTKITIPRLRPDVVVRPRLLQLLEEAVNRSFILISAPAGFGKTTFIISWLNQTGKQSRVAWLSLDQDDGDPVRFLYYMIATLQSIEPMVLPGSDLTAGQPYAARPQGLDGAAAQRDRRGARSHPARTR